MTVHIDRQKHVGWQLDVKKQAQLHIPSGKKGHSAHHNIKDLYCFPDFLYIYFCAARCLSASHDMLECMFSLPAGSCVLFFFISITAGISGVFALCTKAWWHNKLLIFHSI